VTIGVALAVFRRHESGPNQRQANLPPWVWPANVKATRAGTRGKISGSCARRITGSSVVTCESVPGRSSTPRKRPRPMRYAI
jgi:hypothetical protein